MREPEKGEARAAAGSRRRWLRPAAMADTVCTVDLEQLWQQGVRALLLDLDNTLVHWNQEELPPAIRAWVQAAQARGMHLCIVSNAFRGGRVRRVAEALGIGCVVRSGKPFPRAFRRGMASLGATPAQTCAIGDQVFTDILGANRLGLMTVLVTPLHPTESPHTQLIRFLERPLRRRWRRQTPPGPTASS